MATREEYAKQPFEKRVDRMSPTADELAAAIRGRSDAEHPYASRGGTRRSITITTSQRLRR
jgi:hypothetical protein